MRQMKTSKYGESLKQIIRAVSGTDATETQKVVCAVVEHDALAAVAEIALQMNVGAGAPFTKGQLESLNDALVNLSAIRESLSPAS